MTDSNHSQNSPTKETANQARFEILRIYVKEQSCKVPNAPTIFQETAKPEVNFEMNVKHERIDENVYQVTLKIHATSKVEQRTAFVIEVQQAGIFKLENLDENKLKFILEARCPEILFGYTRKNIADATMEAGFAPLTLAPIDFEGMYVQRQNKQAKTTAATGAKQ